MESHERSISSSIEEAQFALQTHCLHINDKPKFKLGWFQKFLPSFSLKLKAYVIETYIDFLEFFTSWDIFKKFKFIPLVGAKHTPPTCWRLMQKGFKAQWCW
jgi:hypothetical protein